jgi:hypothetical protein
MNFGEDAVMPTCMPDRPQTHTNIVRYNLSSPAILEIGWYA